MEQESKLNPLDFLLKISARTAPAQAPEPQAQKKASVASLSKPSAATAAPDSIKVCALCALGILSSPPVHACCSCCESCTVERFHWVNARVFRHANSERHLGSTRLETNTFQILGHRLYLILFGIEKYDEDHEDGDACVQIGHHLEDGDACVQTGHHLDDGDACIQTGHHQRCEGISITSHTRPQVIGEHRRSQGSCSDI